MLKRMMLFSLVMTLLAPLAFAGPENIKLPEDYQATFTNYVTADRLSPNDDQIIKLFANDTALSGPRTNGALPNGSIIVGEIYKAKRGKDGNVIESALGRRIRDKLAAIVVLQKEEGWGAGYPDNLKMGDWEFAAFSPDGKPAKKDFNKCRECHVPLKETDFLFSYEHVAK